MEVPATGFRLASARGWKKRFLNMIWELTEGKPAISSSNVAHELGREFGGSNGAQPEAAALCINGEVQCGGTKSTTDDDEEEMLLR